MKIQKLYIFIISSVSILTSILSQFLLVGSCGPAKEEHLCWLHFHISVEETHVKLGGQFYFIMNFDGAIIFRHFDAFDSLYSHHVGFAWIIMLISRNLCYLIIYFIILAHMTKLLFILCCCFCPVHNWC